MELVASHLSIRSNASEGAKATSCQQAGQNYTKEGKELSDNLS